MAFENQQLAENYTDQLLENLRKGYSSFKDNIWGANVAGMIRDFGFYYVFLVFIVNMHGLFF